MKPLKPIIVLASGGIDSSVLLHVMARKSYRVHPVFVRQGMVWERAELFWLRKFLAAYRRLLRQYSSCRTGCPTTMMYRRRFGNERLEPLTILDVPVKELYGRHWSLTGYGVPGYHSADREVYLPGRNVLLISQAAVWGRLHGICEIALGPLAGNPFADSTREFFDRMEQALSRGLGIRFRIHAPFLKLKKRDVLRLGRELPLELTFSCLRPEGNRPCGNCNKCREREAVIPRTATMYRACLKHERPCGPQPRSPRRQTPCDLRV